MFQRLLLLQDDALTVLDYKYASVDTLKEFPKWKQEQWNAIMKTARLEGDPVTIFENGVFAI